MTMCWDSFAGSLKQGSVCVCLLGCLNPNPLRAGPCRSVEASGVYGVLQQLCRLAHTELPAMRPRELSNLLWSVAVLDYPLEEELLVASVQVGLGVRTGWGGGGAAAECPVGLSHLCCEALRCGAGLPA